MGFLQGKKILITGLLSNRSIAYGIAEACKRQHNEGIHGTAEMKLAGRIPDVFVNKYLTDNNVTFAQFIKEPEHARRVLNDPAMAHFRVWKGKI